MVKELIEKWKNNLDIDKIVELWKISRWDITNERGTRGGSLVGVIQKDNRIIIIHTRSLTEEDIVHELLHVKYPNWSEEEIRTETSLQLGG